MTAVALSPQTLAEALAFRRAEPDAPPAPIPSVPGQKAIPEYLGLDLGQQKLMKGREP